MIVYLYFKDKKKLKIVKKIMFFFKCKMFLKKRTRIPLLKAPYFFSIRAAIKKKKKSLWFQSIPLSKYPYTFG
jgi:hypothetical protein